MVREDDGDDDTELTAVDVELPVELLREIDTFATHNGYETPDAVVSAALAREESK